jgi:hypothetical protein
MMNTILEIHPKELKFICKFIIGRWPMLIILFIIKYLCDRCNNHFSNLNLMVFDRWADSCA